MDVASDDFEARLQQALVAFRAIPPKPSKPASQRKQAVATLFDEITRLKTHGYDFEELREFVLEHAEVEMSVGTLRKYWSAERQLRQGKKPQRRRAGKPKRHTKSSLPTQEPENLVQMDEENQAEQKKTANSPEPAATNVSPVTPDDDSKDAWPPVQDRETESPPESEPERPTKHYEPDSWNDDDDDIAWSGGDWGDDNPPAGGLLNERKFNVIERD